MFFCTSIRTPGHHSVFRLSLEGEVLLLETSGLKDTIFVFYLPKSLPFTKIGKKTLLSKKDKFDTKTWWKVWDCFLGRELSLTHQTHPQWRETSGRKPWRGRQPRWPKTLKNIKYKKKKPRNTKVRAPLVTMAEAVFLFWVSRSSWEGKPLLAVK